jgi:site-specific recombinase XerD
MTKKTTSSSSSKKAGEKVDRKVELQGFETYLRANVTTNHHSIKEYLYTIGRFIENLGNKPLVSVTESDINEFIVKQKERYKPNTLTNRMASLRHLMRYLKKDIVIPIPPTIETRTEKDVLTQEEIQKLFQATVDNPRNNAILKTLYYTELRKSELVALDLDDIDYQAKTVRVRNGKGRQGSPEVISISDIALESIKAYQKIRGIAKDGHQRALFLNIDQVRLTDAGVDFVLKKAVSKTDIQKHVYPHMLRASLITHMANSGASVFVIQQQSRHKSLSSLKRYVRPTQAEKLKNYQNYVPNITETEVISKQQEQPQPPEPKKPKQDTDPMVGSMDESTKLKLRLLEIEKEEIRLKLANNKTEIYYQ